MNLCFIAIMRVPMPEGEFWSTWEEEIEEAAEDIPGLAKWLDLVDESLLMRREAYYAAARHVF